MRAKVKQSEIEELAAAAGLSIHHECGGFRVQQDGRNLFPEGLICPTTTKRECLAFLRGVHVGIKRVPKPPKSKTGASSPR